MTLRRRILLYYSVTLSVALVIIGYWSWFEFEEQRYVALHHGVDAALEHDSMVETMEIILFGGLPATLLGIFAGTFLVRRALLPIEEMTDALERTTASTLSDLVQRTGSGDELDRMAAVFNGMKVRLGASFTQAREFTLHASHELKTPLTIIHATLERMLTEADQPVAKQRERVASMLEEVQRLSGIVGQLEFLAKADAGLLSASQEIVAMDELVKDITEDLVILTGSTGITIELTECVRSTVMGDKMRLRQLLLNLADNAVKYNVPHGTIRLSLTNQGDRSIFKIINTGQVLSPELEQRVFERFFRGDASHSSAVEGSGLGLSIAESIAQTHMGKLEFEVLADERIQLTLTLPRVQTTIFKS